MSRKHHSFSITGFYPRTEETEARSSFAKSSQMGNGMIPFIGPFFLGPPQIPSTCGSVLNGKICEDIWDMVLL